MINPASVTVSFALVLLALAVFKPRIGQIVFGIFFLVMAWGVNFPLLLASPELFVAAGANASVPLYRWFFTEVLTVYPIPFIILLIMLETTIGILSLTKGKWAKVGLALGVLFCLGITGVGAEELTAPSLAMAPLWLIRQQSLK